MKGRSSIFHHESGYFFPFVLFVVAILLGAIITSIMIYQNERIISDQLQEQMYAQALVQMSRATFKANSPHDEIDKGIEYYQFPLGEVEVHFDAIDSQSVLLEMYMTTINNTYFKINVTMYDD